MTPGEVARWSYAVESANLLKMGMGVSQKRLVSVEWESILTADAELTRLRAIETAAREYVAAVDDDPCGYKDQWEVRRQRDALAYQHLARLLGMPGYEVILDAH